MRVTIVTLHDGALTEQFVGAVEGSLSQEQRNALKVAYDATLEDPGNTRNTGTCRSSNSTRCKSPKNYGLS
jgi:hypothetical protein